MRKKIFGCTKTLTFITHKSFIQTQIKTEEHILVLYLLVEFRRPFDVIGNHSEKNILSLQQSRQRRPIVPTGEPLRVNTHYYTIFSRAQPSDIPYAHMRRQIYVIKGCKVDLQLRPEYRTLGNASTNHEPVARRTAPRINLLETNENRGCGGFGPAIIHVLRSQIPFVLQRIAVDSIERCRVVYDLRATVTPAIKWQQWKCRMRLKADATTPDHCDECNNGIHETMVATGNYLQP